MCNTYKRIDLGPIPISSSPLTIRHAHLDILLMGTSIRLNLYIFLIEILLWGLFVWVSVIFSDFLGSRTVGLCCKMNGLRCLWLHSIIPVVYDQELHTKFAVFYRNPPPSTLSTQVHIKLFHNCLLFSCKLSLINSTLLPS